MNRMTNNAGRSQSAKRGSLPATSADGGSAAFSDRKKRYGMSRSQPLSTSQRVYEAARRSAPQRTPTSSYDPSLDVAGHPYGLTDNDDQDA